MTSAVRGPTPGTVSQQRHPVVLGGQRVEPRLDRADGRRGSGAGRAAGAARPATARRGRTRPAAGPACRARQPGRRPGPVPQRGRRPWPTEQAADAVLAADPLGRRAACAGRSATPLPGGPRRHRHASSSPRAASRASFRASSRSVLRLTCFHCQAAPVVLATQRRGPSCSHRSWTQPAGSRPR